MRSLLLAFVAVSTGLATNVRIKNLSGNVTVQSVMAVDALEWHVTGGTRATDVQVNRNSDSTSIICQSDDKVQIDLMVTVSHTAHLEVETKSGSISMTGLIRGARLVTESGNVLVSTPWELMRFHALSARRPGHVITPFVRGVFFTEGSKDELWAFANTTPEALTNYGNPITAGWRLPWQRSFGAIEVIVTGMCDRFELAAQKLPNESWVRFPEVAVERLNVRRRSLPKALETAAGASVPSTEVPENEAVFRSNVRLVAVTAAIYDPAGRPVTGLEMKDFELFEDDHPQSLAFVRSGESPFDIILLLDLSISTFLTRPLIIEGARRFIETARPGDRIAVHALADTLFQVMSPLTQDRDQLMKALDSIPPIAGASPIYDAIVLSYAQEAGNIGGRTAALVVLTDGMDNQFEAPGRGSKILFDRLRAAAAEWPVPIYTILVPYEHRDFQAKAQKNMEALANATAGRESQVKAPTDLNSAYERVNEDLRSVYTIGYYPANQILDGSWREIRLRVKRPGVTFRTRPGYNAW